MQSRLTKTLYLGLAALSLGAVTAASTTANAASKAKVTSTKKLSSAPETRNVVATGKNALYTKPGTVKGAKVVASKAKMAKLANSKKSADYFRAYSIATTNKGSVYYKVVTMNGKYRGYVYGGKSADAFAKGIVSAETTKSAALPSRTAGFKLTDVKKNTLWNAPKYTQYKAKKVSMYGVKDTDTFTVSKAATKTREGSLYYYVTDAQRPSVSGWIYVGNGYQDATTVTLGGLTLGTAEAAATNDNSVKIVYRDAAGQTVGNATWITAAAKTKAGDKVNDAKNAAGVSLSDFIANSKPANYKLNATVDTANATYGNTVYVDVVAAATSKIQMVIDNVDAKAGTVTNPLGVNDVLSASDLSATLSTAGINALTGTQGQAFSTTDLNAVKTALGANNAVKGAKVYHDANGKSYYYEFTFEPENFNSDNRTKNYGDTLKASFKATLVEGKLGTTTSNSNWIA